MTDLNTVITRLEENQLSYKVVKLSNHAKILVSEYGGRILGPFLNNQSSFCWINPCFKEEESFQNFLKLKEWNLGGERIWLAPEMQYNVPDENDFWGSYRVPENLDPGNYKLTQNLYGHPMLSQEMMLKVYNQPIKEKALYIERIIRPINNPIDKANSSDVLFCGYAHEIILQEKINDGIVSEAWDLLQVNTAGTMYIPTTNCAEYTEYYEPFEPGYQEIHPTYVKLKIDAKKRYKVGYKAAFTTGRSGYLSENGGSNYLMIRNYFNDITGEYVKSPVNMPRKAGNALHVYNDDGNIGQFAEHECSCSPIGGNIGREKSHNRVDTMFFIGDMRNINEISRQLLGVEIG